MTNETKHKQNAANETAIGLQGPIESRILNIRGRQVILDRDLAELYGVETKVLNQAVKRNAKRFPEDFMFQLTKEESIDFLSSITSQVDVSNQDNINNPLETNTSRSQFVTMKTKRGKNLKYRPYVLTLRAPGVAASVYTGQIKPALQKAHTLHNQQYPAAPIRLQTYSNNFHDRFIIIDDTVYHVGASLKDLGKRLFAFTRMELNKSILLAQL